MSTSSDAVFEAFARMGETLRRNNIPAPLEIHLPFATFIILLGYGKPGHILQGDSLVVNFSFGKITFYCEDRPHT